MNYLAVDFGTTNSLAGIIDERGKLNLVQLEENEFEMPSSIFLKVIHELPLEINNDFLEVKAKKLFDNDQIRFSNEHSEVTKRLEEFIKLNNFIY
jgi:hypothetical protein